MVSRANIKLEEAPLKYEELMQGEKDDKIVDIIERGKTCKDTPLKEMFLLCSCQI